VVIKKVSNKGSAEDSGPVPLKTATAC